MGRMLGKMKIRPFPDTERKKRDTIIKANKREEVRRIQCHLCQVRDLSSEDLSARPPMSSRDVFGHTLAGMSKAFLNYFPYVSPASEHCKATVPCHLWLQLCYCHSQRLYLKHWPDTCHWPPCTFLTTTDMDFILQKVNYTKTAPGFTWPKWLPKSILKYLPSW